MPPQKKESSIPIDEVTNSWSNMIKLILLTNYFVFVTGPFSSSEEFPVYKASIDYRKSINRSASFLNYPQTSK